jgi:hypothetical protein
MKGIVSFSIILTTLLAPAAFASDWYVRPADGSYGAGDGTSYADAWNGLLNVVWGLDGVCPGDTLWICGLHIHNLIQAKSHIDKQADIDLISGTSESARVTIRGDYPNDPGIVWGTYKMSHETWIEEGHNVWSITLPGSQYPAWFFEDITAERWTILDTASSLEECRNNPGSYYSPDFLPESKLYVHCTDSAEPTGRIYANRWGYDWKIDGKHHITFLNLKFYCPARFSWTGSGIVATHLKWEGCTLWYGEHSLITPLPGCQYWEVRDCDIAWAAGGGIYTIHHGSGESAKNASSYVFSGNTIHDIGVRVTTSDAHGIGIQGGNDGIIEGNHIFNCGTGITLYSFTFTEMKNNIVRYNFVKDTHTNGGANSRGIETQCDNDSLSDKTGNIFHHNIVVNCSVGFRFQFEDEQYVYNNIACNCDVGLAAERNYGGYATRIKARNNIFFHSGTRHIRFLAGGDTISSADFDFNLYYPDGSDKFQLYDRVTKFKGWKSFRRRGYTFDRHGLAENPKFINRSGDYSQDTDFKLQNDSPAVDAGVDVGLSRDRNGTSIPLGSAPDIGAYESVESNSIKTSVSKHFFYNTDKGFGRICVIGLFYDLPRCAPHFFDSRTEEHREDL